MKAKTGLFVAGAFAALVIAACEGTSSTGSNMGTVNVLMTDAPIALDSIKNVNIYVLRIDGKIADTDSAESANENDSTGGWRTLVSPAKSIDLLTLRNGATTNLGATAFPVGTYRSFRLVIDPSKSNVVMTNGTTVDVMWPSAGKNGIKILLDKPFNVVDGTTNLLIDFDAANSFVMRGNSIRNNGLLFKPVIRATTK
jgi:hypothetical protein